MDLTTLIPSLLLAGVGLALLFWLGKIIVRALTGVFLGGLSVHLWWNLRSKGARLSAIDALINQGQFSHALTLLEQSLILSTGALDPRGMEAIVAHHLGVLSRFGTIADARDIQSGVLPIVEGLLGSRLELWRAVAQARQSANKARSKMDAQGNERPWVNDEFQRHLRDLNDRLVANKQAVEQQIKELSRELLTDTQTPINYPFH